LGSLPTCRVPNCLGSSGQFGAVPKWSMELVKIEVKQPTIYQGMTYYPGDTIELDDLDTVNPVLKGETRKGRRPRMLARPDMQYTMPAGDSSENGDASSGGSTEGECYSAPPKG
jgi:hypothetical protein